MNTPVENNQTQVQSSLPLECCAKCKIMVTPPPEMPGMTPFCRRFPPTPIIVRVNWNEDNSQVISQVQLAVHPIVAPVQWCGEFSKNLAGLN